MNDPAERSTAGPPGWRTGEALGSHAKVWDLYLSASEKYNDKMIDGWNKSSDILLVFVSFGIFFSGFLISHYRSLGRPLLRRLDHIPRPIICRPVCGLPLQHRRLTLSSVML